MPSNEHQPTEPATEKRESVVVKPSRQRLIGAIGLAAYTIFLVYRALSQGAEDAGHSVAVWELQDFDRILAWLGGLFLVGLTQFACFIPMGFLAALVFLRRPLKLHVLLLAGVIGVAVAVPAAGLTSGPTAAIGLVLAWLGCLFGVWTGATWRRGWPARLWMLPKVALLAGLMLAAFGVLLWMSVETEPLPFEPATVTSARKRELVRLVRSKNPRSLEPGQMHTLRLTEQDVNVLLAWGLSIGAGDGKARVDFEPNEASVQMSMPISLAGRKRYVNLHLAGDVGVSQGDLRLHVGRLRLGHLEVPPVVVNLWGRPVASLIQADRRAEPFLDATEAAQVGPDWIEATYGKVDLPPGFREDLFGPAGASQAVLAGTRAQAEHLLEVVNGQPHLDPLTVELCFETVFTLAQQRSVEGDPVVENRAAVFALGVLLGHRRLEEFLGPVLPERPGRLWALRRVPLRGRTDWTKHFCLSAAIALLSDAPVSDAAGLLKEELDAGAGGSGFSFADLLADRAGTTFAVCATRDERSARAMQDRIAGGFEIGEVFPSPVGLPEGISDAEFQSHYGGVGGSEYTRWVDDIERRVSGCIAYR